MTDWIPRIPLADWTNVVVAWITETFEGLFDALSTLIEGMITGIATVLTFPPELVVIVALAVVAFLMAGWRIALLTAVGLMLIVSLELWDLAMDTLALVLASAATALAIAVPIGIVAAKSRTVEAILRPVLDTMQTMPAFVYLVPVVIVLGLGNAPALIATVVFAMPPAVRLTMLGIQQVSKETVEAAHAFGSTPWQTLAKVELPLSVRSIMAGVNQAIMLSLSMVVIASLVGAEGLGEPVLVGLGNLDVGAALVGGVGIVILAVILDRTTRGLERGSGVGVSKILSRERTKPEPGSTLSADAGSSSDGSGG